MKKGMKTVAVILTAAMIFSGCSTTTSTENAVESSTEENVTTQAESSGAESTGESLTISEERTSIVLSDEGITVDGEAASTDSSSAVYVGADIIYYEEGKDETYGEGSEEDAHSSEEAAKHTVITITKPGTYEVSGSITNGQISVDLGEDAKEDAEAVVNLVLNNAEINCTVAPAIIVLNAYECGDKEEENAKAEVSTENAGFNLILAKDSENVINGSYVAKIYKDGTTKEDVENDEAKKKYKFDGAIQSQVSCNIDSQENGKLTVNAEREGISSALHLTINNGEIVINSADDAMNANEDYVSVITINGGVITCDYGLGEEGDGIDSNGYLVINGGYLIACANGKSGDSGIDSDKGIYINGGTVLASGNMYDEVSSDSKQLFAVFNFADTVNEGELIMITDESDKPIIAFSAVNSYSTAVYSQPELVEGTYHLYKVSSVTGDLNGSIYTNITEYQDASQLQTGSGFTMGGPGMGGGRGQMPGESEDGEVPAMADGKAPEMPEGEAPEKPEGEMPEMKDGEKPEMPEGEMPEMKEGEAPEKPEGEMPEMKDGEKPEMPEGEAPDMQKGGRGEKGKGFEGAQTESSTEFVLSKESYQFSGITLVNK